MSGKSKKKKVVEDEAAEEEGFSLMKRSQPSVEIKKDAKGNISWTVKVYDDDVMEAQERAAEAFAQLEKDYGD